MFLPARVFDIAAGNSGGPESAYRASSLEFCKFCGFAGFSNRNVSRLLEALQGVPQRPKRSMERPGIDPDILEDSPGSFNVRLISLRDAALGGVQNPAFRPFLAPSLGGNRRHLNCAH